MKKSYANTQPAAVVLEDLPNGRTRVILSKDAVLVEKEDGSVWEYEEAAFYLPEGRTETVESITENFDAWWAYSEVDHSEPTIEERVSAIEEFIMDLV